MISICVIGGGASGLVAAITAARNGASVTILEQKERLGKKILSTGNGRCNLTNEYMDLSCFRGEDLSLAEQVLSQFGYQDTLDFFEELGVLTKSRNGYIYPRSDQATTIVEALELELKRLGVMVYTNTRVNDVYRTKKGFSILATEKRPLENSHSKTSSSKNKKKKVTEYTENEVTYRADKIILATGGKAASVLGSDGSGYMFAKEFGHSISPVVPALVQLRANDASFKQLAGIRTDGTVKLFVDGQLKGSDTGEIQLTEYGISGIPVFQISRFAALGLYQKNEVKASLDFIPYSSEDEFVRILLKRIQKWKNNRIDEFLSGILNKKLIPVFLEKMNMRPSHIVENIPQTWFEEFAHFCKDYEVIISDTNSFDQAQVCAGGVRTKEIDPNTLESKYTDNLYITGELLDVEGICGGYNLQWAWATGFIAGNAASN